MSTAWNPNLVIKIGDRADTIRNHVLDRLGRIIDGTALPTPSQRDKAMAASIVSEIFAVGNSGCVALDDERQALIEASCNPTPDTPEDQAAAKEDAAQAEYSKTGAAGIDMVTLAKIALGVADDQTIQAAKQLIADADAAKTAAIGAVDAAIPGVI